MTSLLLFSCGVDTSIPEGMKVIDGSESDGYIFFAPEEWTKGEKMGEVAYVYVSRTNKTSVSFTEIKKSDVASLKPDPGVSDEEFFLNGYFDSLKAEFPESTKWGDKLGEKVLLGSGETKADGAVKYTYNYLYEDARYDNNQRMGFVQILATHNGRFYILTYCSPLDDKGDTTTYDFYLDKFNEIVDNFRFYKGEDKAPEKKEYTKDAAGDVLASDKKLAGFDLYVPESFEVEYSSAIISATHEDGSNITMTKATATGVNIKDYWLLRKKQLELYVSSVTDIGTNPTAIEISNADNAAVCEYTYVYGGKTFHVYQVYFIGGRFIKNGYIFTYTATDDNYSSHIADINRILAKVKF